MPNTAEHDPLMEAYSAAESYIAVFSSAIAVYRLKTLASKSLISFRVQPGDRLVLVGDADRFVDCAPLFREQTAGEGTRE